MNQKQRNYVIKQLEQIRDAKSREITEEFNEKYSPWGAIDSIVKNKTVVKGDSEGEVSSTIVNWIPDNVKVDLIKLDYATLKGPSFYINKDNFVRALKKGSLKVREREECKHFSIHSMFSIVNCLMSHFEFPFVGIDNDPEYKERLAKLAAEHKRIERNIMLDSNEEILKVIREFEECHF